MSALALVSAVLAALALPACLYLGALALLARRQGAPPPAAVLPRIAVVVPAHDEERQLAATVQSLLDLDYPAAQRRVVVVADNCQDRTAQVAREAGAEAWERRDDEKRGKGFALDWAFARLLDEGWADAVVVVDADTLVSRHLLAAFAAHLARGAQALQAEYAVRNVDESWRTALMAVALALFHRTRSLARERLGLSCGLRGNGMGFTAACLRQVPHRASGLVEDVEHGVALGLAGVRVVYVAEAEVRGEMAASGQAALSQRRRWEGGRLALLRQTVPPLLAAAWRRRSGVALDLALDQLVPPLSTLALAILAGLGLELGLWLGRGAPSPAAWAWALAAAALATYVLRGLQLSGLGWRGVRALAHAPAYIAWKLLVVRGRGASGKGPWVRTRRSAEDAPRRR